jgi:hypothetical protein
MRERWSSRAGVAKKGGFGFALKYMICSDPLFGIVAARRRLGFRPRLGSVWLGGVANKRSFGFVLKYAICGDPAEGAVAGSVAARRRLGFELGSLGSVWLGGAANKRGFGFVLKYTIFTGESSPAEGGVDAGVGTREMRSEVIEARC